MNLEAWLSREREAIPGRKHSKCKDLKKRTSLACWRIMKKVLGSNGRNSSKFNGKLKDMKEQTTHKRPEGQIQATYCANKSSRRRKGDG